MKAKVIGILASVFVIVLGAFVGLQQTCLKERFPDITEIELQSTMSVEGMASSYELFRIETSTQNDFENIVFCTEPGRLVTAKELSDLYPEVTDYLNTSRIEGRETRYFLLPVSFINEGDETAQIKLPDFQIETGIKDTYLDPSLYEAINKNSLSMQVDAQAEESATLIYTIGNEGFSKTEWDAFQERNFDIVMFFYPYKYSINVGIVG